MKMQGSLLENTSADGSGDHQTAPAIIDDHAMDYRKDEEPFDLIAAINNIPDNKLIRLLEVLKEK
jgi:hypothetical protein